MPSRSKCWLTSHPVRESSYPTTPDSSERSESISNPIKNRPADMLELQQVSKTYRTSEVETRALDQICLQVSAGEFLAIMGPSGCGKSTLLNILGLLDSPSEGSYLYCGEEI